jgi:tRNA(Ile2) C34 agmatinyltransferase TiaS
MSDNNTEEKRVIIQDWVPVAEAVRHAYAQLGRPMPDNGIPVPDWNLAVHVYKYTTENETKCAHCGTSMRWFQAYRCFDCKSSLCEICAPQHFGPGHQARAKAAHG